MAGIRARVPTPTQPTGPAPAAPAAVRPRPPGSRSAASQSGPPAIRLGAVPHAPGGGGQPLPQAVQGAIQESLRVDLAAVRVHTDGRAHRAAERLSARAFTVANHIFLGRGERPTDLALVSHETAHVVQQQGSPAVQRFSEPGQGGDRFESEAHQAAAAVEEGRPFAVQERTPRTRVQRLGVSDVLDFFADKANLIPGFRMFTIVLGVNPINMSAVDRSAANILRAVVEFIPGGTLITQALDNYGVFDKVGTWVEQQIRTLGLVGSAIKAALMQFLDSLGLSDIFHPGDVWDRAKRIFTEPIDRIINFAKGLINGILKFIKDAILRPLAKLAEGTSGWDLLKAALGQDPITGDPVPRTADTLIGGFMKLIGQEEVWQNLKKANAVARAWAWFQGALGGLLGFVRQIPSMFLQALQALELADIVLLPRAFAKVGRAFAGFAGQFIAWAGQQVLSLLQIIFEVLAPAAMPYIRKAAGAFRTIIQNPIGFVGNLVRAGMQGFRQFGSNFLTHLRTSLINWLTGTLSGANIYIPQAFNLREIIKFVLSVLGLTWQNIRQKLVRVIGETAVKVLETGFEIVVTLVTQGPAAAWEKIKENIANLQQMVMDQIMTFVRDRIVQAAITRLVTSLNPAGAFIQAVIAIYNTIMFFIERLRQIAQVAMAFIDSISAIASGAIGAAASKVERTMAGLLTLVISFLARLVGLGKVSDAVVNLVNRIRAPIDRALDKVVEWIVAMARKLGKLVAGAFARPQPAAAAAAAGEASPRIAVPVSLGPQSHEVIFEPAGQDVSVKIASGTPLPMTDTFARLMAQVDSWRRYIISIQEPEVKAKFQPILARLNAYHGAKAEAFKKLYRRYYPGGDAPRPLPPQQHRQAGRDVSALNNEVAQELAEIRALIQSFPPAALSGLSPADFEKLAMTEGTRIWSEAWQAKKAAIDAALADENLRGRKVGYRGSAKTGEKGPHKGKIRFDPADFDVDMYVVDHDLYNELTFKDGPYKVIPAQKGIIRPGESRYPALQDLSRRCSRKIDALGTGRPGQSYVVLRERAP